MFQILPQGELRAAEGGQRQAPSCMTGHRRHRGNRSCSPGKDEARRGPGSPAHSSEQREDKAAQWLQPRQGGTGSRHTKGACCSLLPACAGRINHMRERESYWPLNADRTGGLEETGTFRCFGSRRSPLLLP